MINKFKKYVIFFILIILFIPNINSLFAVGNLSNKESVEIWIAPRSARFMVGSTFEAPVYIDTKGKNINTINLKLRFDPKKLSIVNPSGGKSIFDVWIEPPTYSNTNGVASFTGMINQGVVTSSGLIATITFKVITSGNTNVDVLNTTTALLNDGLGTEIPVIVGRAVYVLDQTPQDSVLINSETHPSPDHWYNNSNPVFNWDPINKANGYSTVLDSSPFTTPPAVVNTNDQYSSFQNVTDGISYFHVRTNLKDVWTVASHFQIKIDTVPPEKINIKSSKITGQVGDIVKYMVAFDTNDQLSGVAYYEVGVVNNKNTKDTLPVFIQSESPYIVSMNKGDSVRVIIRAYDNAGNMREGYINLPNNIVNIILISTGLLILLLILLHFLFGHRVLEHLNRAYNFFRKISKEDEKNQNDSIVNNGHKDE
jgi:hypothetical protein